MAENSFVIRDALSSGWKNFKENIGLWLLVEIFLVLVGLVFMSLEGNGIKYIEQYFTTQPDQSLELFGLFSFVSALGFIKLVGGLIFCVGVTRILLDLQDKKGSHFTRLFSQAHKIFVMFVAYAFMHLISSVGLMILVIPGIYFYLLYSQVGFIVVEKKVGPIAAMRMSARLTEGVKWKLLGFYLVCGLINLLGVAVVGIGLLVTLPLTWGAMTHVYRKLHMRAFGVYAHEG